MTIISKQRAHLQTMPFQRNWHKTVGGDAYTRYIVSINFGHKIDFVQPVKKVTKINEPRSDKRDLQAIKSKIEIFAEKKDLAFVNNYRKFEEIIFTNNKDMSV